MSRCASPSGETMSTTSVSPSCAGRSPAGTSSATDSRSASSSCVTSSSGTVGVRLADLELAPVDDVDLRLHGHGRRELPVGLVAARELVVVLRLRDRPNARAGGGVPEPAADVAVDGLGHDPLLAEPLCQDRHRHLPLSEAGDLDRLRQIGGRVLDRVVHVVGRHLHLQANRVAAELLDLRRHWVIQAEAARAESRPRASSATRCSISSRSSRTRSSDMKAGSARLQST